MLRCSAEIFKSLDRESFSDGSSSLFDVEKQKGLWYASMAINNWRCPIRSFKTSHARSKFFRRRARGKPIAFFLGLQKYIRFIIFMKYLKKYLSVRENGSETILRLLIIIRTDKKPKII